MKESGEQYNAIIEVAKEKQTELFKVPAHGNVDHSNILHDFKKVSLVTSKKAKIGVRIYQLLILHNSLFGGCDNRLRSSFLQVGNLFR